MTLERRLGLGANRQLPRIGAVGGTPGPVWNVVMPAGTWHRRDFGPDGKLVVDRPFLEAAIANWKKVGSPGLAINRFHWGSSGDTRVTDPRAKAAVGFMEDFRVNASGDLEALCAWNADGRADIEADRFRYVSPEWHEDWPDPATGKRQGPTLLGAALLNDPFFKNLPALAADEAPTQENPMDRSKLIAMYGLKSDATDADIETAAKAGVAAVKTAADAQAARTASDARTGELEAEMKKATEASEKRIAALEADVKKATEAKLLTDTAALTAKLEREGRIVAAQKAVVEEDVKTFGLEKATARWASAPVVVRLGETGINVPIPEGGEVAPEEAHKQLQAKAAELVKTGTPLDRAYLTACEQNPGLSASAQKLTAIVAKERELERARVGA